MDWDDLRWVLAVAEGGGTEGAASVLGASRSTVYRRLSAIESRTGVLFERHPAGWRPTGRGALVVDAARELRDRMRVLDAALEVRDATLDGEVRLTVVAAMAPLMPELLTRFRQAWPGLRVDLVVADAALALSRREADVALRVVAAPPPSLVGRRIARVAFARYASPAFVAANLGVLDDPDAAAQVVFSAVEGSPQARWQAANVDPARVVFRTNSRAAFLGMVRGGAGVGVAPCGLADPDPGLVRVGPILEALTVPLWVLWPEALRDVPRVRVLARFLVDEVGRRRPLLEGR